MTDQSLSLAVKPIIRYPREAQVGRTYLMTIDLQPEETFEWQYEEEEYPVYCKADSDSFNSQSIGEPVVILHRFGGSYGEAKFLLTAHSDEMEGEIRIALVNKWGVPIKTFQLSPINIERKNLSSSSVAEPILNSELTQEPTQRFTSQEIYHSGILLIGGSEDKIHGRVILYNFFQQAGGMDARIAVISFQSQESERTGRRYRTIFEEMGAREIQVIEIPMQELSGHFGPVSYLEECSGIFISSDDLGISVSDRDARIPSSDIQIPEYGQLANLPILDQIHRRLAERNIALAITGTAMDAVGDVMLTRIASGESPNLSLAEMERGLGLVPGVIYCSYFNNRNRMAQLLSALAQTPANIGLGIDEDTCTFLEEDGVTFQIVGRGAVTVIDKSDLTYSNLENVTSSEPLSLHNLRVHILSHGDRYNLRERTALSPEGHRSSSNQIATFNRQNILPNTYPTIMLIGGAEDNVHGREILHSFFSRSGAADASIAIIPCASRDPGGISGRYRTIFEDMGAREIEVLDIRDRAPAEQFSVEFVQHCTGIFMTGGDQVRLCGLLADTPLMDVIRRRAQLGEVTLAAVSASANAIGHYMIAGGGSGEPPNRSLVDMALGLSLIPEIIADCHFHNRNRITRLISTMAAYPDKLGIGIDEDTCVIVQGDENFQVIGKGIVTIVDPLNLSYTNYPNVESTETLRLHNLRVHLLTHGDRYNLYHREAIYSEDNQPQAEENIKELEKRETIPSRLNYLQRLGDVISSNVSSIKSAIESELENSLLGKKVESHEIPDDNNEATVEAVEEIQAIDLNVSSIEYLNDEKLLIPFELQVECLLQYFVFKADYYSLDDDRNISIDDWNDHYFMAEESYPIEVEGIVAIIPDLENLEFSEFSANDAMDLLADADISIESITRIEVISR
jgi:cyanophycinase